MHCITSCRDFQPLTGRLCQFFAVRLFATLLCLFFAVSLAQNICTSQYNEDSHCGTFGCPSLICNCEEPKIYLSCSGTCFWATTNVLPFPWRCRNVIDKSVRYSALAQSCEECYGTDFLRLVELVTMELSVKVQVPALIPALCCPTVLSSKDENG